ncbi:MAG: signal recognition particle-docking protein FtsY [SAR202 cluster bacterium]|nr:signal recognition particle-docking protein FtsY [SAR202 cluster bacterium]|tara:strand:+ start:21041 stop:21982 length:942 start_codon:yes stop_codon:yes gene_type:complete
MINIFRKSNTANQEQTSKALSKSKQNWFSKIPSLFSKPNLSEEEFELLEEILLSADVGYSSTINIIEQVRSRLTNPSRDNSHTSIQILKEILIESLSFDINWNSQGTEGKPYVILVVGINGVGKTTSIAKLAALFSRQGQSVLLSAGDTFRAAASEQLSHWAEKLDVEIVKQPQGSDPGAVVYDSYRAAVARSIDVLLIDTAGRMNNKSNLMDELAKIKRILTQHDETAPHEVILVLDATTGLNGLEQAKSFTETTQPSGIFLTKLDGTSKGGVVFPITSELGMPVMFIGTGETEDDIAYFNSQQFVEAILET